MKNASELYWDEANVRIVAETGLTVEQIDEISIYMAETAQWDWSGAAVHRAHPNIAADKASTAFDLLCDAESAQPPYVSLDRR